jgi:hypothetical protein
MIKHYLIDGIDRLGKDSLIGNIQNKLGYSLVLHYSKPLSLEYYKTGILPEVNGSFQKNAELREYQAASFSAMFQLLNNSKTPVICNRTHLGENIYAPLYRGYPGDYVFDLENWFSMGTNTETRLILLTENFTISNHFVDDGLSLGSVENRIKEQRMFMDAFDESIIPDKRIICVTSSTGAFKTKAEVLAEALA